MNQPVRKYSPSRKRRRKKQVKFSLKAKVAFAAACMVLVIGISRLQSVQALFNIENSVKLNNADVEDGTLIIGTHLIYLESMSDAVREAAITSQQESSQNNVYYKSELSPGSWFQVTNAEDLSAITEGEPVELTELLELNLTHHTKSDGITYDLVTNQPVCVYDLIDPYNVANLEELDPVKKQYDMKVQMEEDDMSVTDKMNVANIQEMFAKNYHTAETDEIDEAIRALQLYYEGIVRNDEKQDVADQVLSLMGKLDSARRASVFLQLQDVELQDLLEKASKQNKDGDQIVPADASMITAVGDALSNVQTSYNECTANMLEEGEMVLSQVEYEISQQLIAAAKEPNYTKCDESALQLTYLQNITDNVLYMAQEEREFIDANLLPKADSAFLLAVASGVSDAYTEVSSAAAESSKQAALKNQKLKSDPSRSELQFIIKAKVDRMGTADGLAFINGRIDSINEFYDAIKADPFEAYATELVDAYREWLNSVKDTLQNQLGDSSDSVSAMEEKLKGLQEDRLGALDDNDMVKANELDAKIEKMQTDIDKRKEELNAIINSNTATEMQKEEARSKLGTSDDENSIKDLLKDALEDIRSGNLDGVEQKVEAIGALSSVQPELAAGALEDIYQAVSNKMLEGGSDASKLKDIAGAVETTTANCMNNFTPDVSEDDMVGLVDDFFGTESDDGDSGDNGLKDSKSDNTGAGNTGANEDSDKDTAGSTSKSLLDSLSKLNDDDLASAIAGMDMFTKETGSNTTKGIVNTYAQKMSGLNNIHVYEKYHADIANTYVNIDNLAKCISYRSIFRKSLKEVVLQRGNDNYHFSVFSSEVTGTDNSQMNLPAGFQKVIYIDEAYVEKQFTYTGIYLEGSDFAVLLSEDEKDKAEEFFDYIMGMEGK